MLMIINKLYKMKNRRLLTQSLSMMLLLAVFLLSGCIRETIEVERPASSASKEVELAIAVPSSGDATSQSPSTRAIVEKGKHDNLVNEMDILVFSSNGKLEKSFYFDELGSLDGDTKRVKVRLDEGTGYTIVALANCHDIYTTPGNKLEKGDGISGLASMEKSLGEYGEKWNSIPQNGKFIPFPMWGEVETDITSNTHTINIAARRMLAKVNVFVSRSEADDFVLNSVSVYNYNKTGRVVPTGVGKATEVPSRQAATKAEDADGIVYTNNNTDGLNNVAHKYIVENTYDANSVYECLDEIFIPEVESVEGEWKWDLNTCIIIGGTYQGEPSYYRLEFIVGGKNEDIKRNHKYNFNISPIAVPGHKSELEALKNKPANIEYNVVPWDESNIGDMLVDGPYHLSIVPGSTVEFDKDSDTKTLTIFTDHPQGWSLDKEDGASLPTINYGEGSGSGWITLGGEFSGLQNEEKELDIAVLENDTNEERTATIGITCGRIKHKLTIKQSGEYGLISVSFQQKGENGWTTIDKLQFIQSGPEGEVESANSYRVVWSPASNNMVLEVINNVDDNLELTWDNGAGLDAPSSETITDGKGVREFTVKPKPLRESYERGSFKTANCNMVASVGSSENNASSTLKIEQVVGEIWIESAVQLMDGKTHGFIVKANIPWRLYATENYSGNLGPATDVAVVKSVGGVPYDEYKVEGTPEKKLIVEGTHNLANGGDFIEVLTVDDMVNVPRPTIYTGNLGLYAESIDNPAELNYSERLFCASGIKQNGREANCYVLSPESGVGILIPVQAANGVFDQSRVPHWAGDTDYLENVIKNVPDFSGTLKPGQVYGAKLVWTDVAASNGTGLGADGLIHMVIPAGIGPDGYVLVFPGSKAKTEGGNAVVAVTDRDGGRILWSWHVWVTDGMKYSDKNTPMSGIIMGGHFGEEKDQTGNASAKDAANWLDRNLGALGNGFNGNTPAIADADILKSYGLCFQWGRKDPFPSANTVEGEAGAYDEKYERLLYDEKGVIATKTPTGSVTHKNLTATTGISASILEPLSYANNWRSVTGISGVGNNSWGGATNGTKTIFDPCPAGWRVPKDGVWGIEDNESYWGTGLTSYGRSYTRSDYYKGGYYPAAGQRNAIGLYGIGRSGYNWCRSYRTTSATISSNLYFNNSNVYPSYSDFRDYGSSVRCVSESSDDL